MNYRTVPLDKNHDRSGFDCGIVSLNRYLQRQASQDVKRKVASVYVLCDGNSDGVLGYYSLSSSTIDLNTLPEEKRKKLPRYPSVPATLLGRLAVDQAARGRGVGETLLLDALLRSLHASDVIASYAVLVDALDVEPDPMLFYEKYDFVSFLDSPRTAFLPMKTIKSMLASSDD